MIVRGSKESDINSCGDPVRTAGHAEHRKWKCTGIQFVRQGNQQGKRDTSQLCTGMRYVRVVLLSRYVLKTGVYRRYLEAEPGWST